MKILALFIALALFSCKSKQWKYRIEGEVETRVKLNDWPQQPLYETRKRKAVWYTERYTLSGDTLVITNSDNSQWKIVPPYKILTLK